jgi:hypothetical protein
MSLQAYQRLSCINAHLTEAIYQLEQLGSDLKLDETPLRLIAEQVEKVRSDTNCWLARKVQDVESQRLSTSQRNWRLTELWHGRNPEER